MCAVRRLAAVLGLLVFPSQLGDVLVEGTLLGLIVAGVAFILPAMLLTGVLAWAYVAARFVHSYIHLGGNVLQARIGAYFTSWAVLIALWTWLVIGVALLH